jgi:hypothetical protein
MAEHVWTVLCQKTVMDADSNLLGMLDVFDKLILNPTPESPDIQAKLDEAHKEGNKGIAFPARIRIVSQWVRSDMSKPEDSSYRLAFVDPLGERLLEQIISLELSTNKAQRITIRSEGLMITELGSYCFVVERPKQTEGGGPPQWAPVAKVPLEVVIAATPKVSSTVQEQLSEPTPAAPRKSSSRRGPSRPFSLLAHRGQYLTGGRQRGRRQHSRMVRRLRRDTRDGPILTRGIEPAGGIGACRGRAGWG